jgi:signal transduction histidine kinase/CheY-like chemotaxis protein
MNKNEIIISLNSDDLKNSSLPILIINENGLIKWLNSAAKELLRGEQVENKNIFSLFKIDSSVLSKTISVQDILLDNEDFNLLRISKIYKKNVLIGYLAELFPKRTIDCTSYSFIEILLKENLNDFFIFVLSEMQMRFSAEYIFTIVFQNNIATEIFSIDKEQNSIYFSELKKIVNNSLVPLKKWLFTNKTFFISENIVSSLGYQLNQFFDKEFVFINPSFYKDKILALTIFTKKERSLCTHHKVLMKDYSDIISLGVEFLGMKQNYQNLEIQLSNSQKLEAVGKFAAGIAHDFNNLLASILGSINLLKSKLNDQLIALKLIDNIENCSIRARDLTKGILSYGKPTQPRKEIVFLDNIINELIKVLNETFPKSIQIKFSIDKSLNKISGNSTELYQILMNLCVNAKEAIQDNGIISIKAKNLLIDEENIYLYPFLNKGNYVKITISDNGCGIDEENLSKIFDPYFSTKQKDTGSGLGLYVSSQLVKAMSGIINVDSKLNEGTNFTIYFPAIIVKEQIVISKKEKIIMLADDEEMLNDLLGDLLESNGYYVIKANNTKDVFRILTEELKVDLLIIDYNLPEINGLQCVAKLREMGQTMPVILASGAENFNNEELQKANVNQTIQKPYEFDLILDTIKKLLVEPLY